MRKRLKRTLEPRKSPIQARSAASVEAILEATIQVLLKAGEERLTTTRVAERAGVSVGTPYQYFPNKSALLQPALQRHMEGIGAALQTVCREQMGSSLEKMATARNSFPRITRPPSDSICRESKPAWSQSPAACSSFLAALHCALSTKHTDPKRANPGAALTSSFLPVERARPSWPPPLRESAA